MSTCKDCKNWGSEPYEYFDVDKMEPFEHAHRKCELVKLLGYDGKAPDPTIPFARDASEYSASLWTPPTWTCPRFEAKS